MFETRPNFKLFSSKYHPNDFPRNKSGVHPIYHTQASR
jgi:hypothetical protein